MKLKLVLVVLGMLFSAGAFAAQGPYFSVSAGGTFTSDGDTEWADGTSAKFSYDPGVAVAAAIGGDFRDFRLEGEIGYKMADLDTIEEAGVTYDLTDAEISHLSFMSNGYISFWNRSTVTPFITAGLGFSLATIQDGDVEKDEMVFAYQAGAGLSFEMSGGTNFDLTYKYFATSDIDFGTQEVEYASHNVTAGIRFNF